MTTPNMFIQNISRALFRQQNNDINDALVTMFDGTDEPNPAYPGMWWRNRNVNELWKRNGANTAWNKVGTLDADYLNLLPNQNGIITTVLILDDAVTLAKIAHGTAGGLLVYDLNGVPIDLGAGVAGQILKSAGPNQTAVWDDLIPPAASVNQNSLKTAVGEVSTAFLGLPGVNLTLPGGEYGFYPQIKHSTNGQPVNAQLSGSLTALPSTYTTVIHMYIDYQGGSVGTADAQQRYIQASPPYRLSQGDGDVHGFLFALVENGSGKIEAMYHAPEPPWANNGPTKIRPDRIDPITKKKFIKQYENKPTLEETKNAPLLLDRLVNGGLLAKDEKFDWVEINHSIKNADMNLIPHPFMNNDLTGKTVVLVDPLSDFVRQLGQMQADGENTLQLFHGNYVDLDNQELSRGAPAGVSCFKAKLKNSQ